MAVIMATKTMEAIEKQIEGDQGAAFRQFLQKVLPHMADAYRGESFPFRTHLGASLLGEPCARKIWYGFRWAVKPRFSGRIMRLFNRGHTEEARFIAMLLAIGVQVYQQDSQGNQFRISELGGHLGGSGDGVGVGLPDLPIGTPALLEFKTHSSKYFVKLKDGVKIAKPMHYTQMQTYMRKMGLTVAMYGAVNKDNDELHLEIVYLDAIHADIKLERGRNIIMMTTQPDRINNSPGWYECKYCDYKAVCHGGSAMERNCRTCVRSVVVDNGTWVCGQTGEILSKEQQYAGCSEYQSL